jgi:tetratricopeptide (TPR) repeat protein
MNTNNLTEFLKTAFEYKNNGDYKNSIDYFYKALAIDNESSEIMSELALLYTKLNQYDRALSFYEQILSRNPNNN